jgi:hypothetical protein
MAENPGKNASTHKGSLIGKRIKVDQVSAGQYFESRCGRRGLDVNATFVVTVDNQQEPDMRIITFEDPKGQVGTGAASIFLLLE